MIAACALIKLFPVQHEQFHTGYCCTQYTQDSGIKMTFCMSVWGICALSILANSVTGK
jgi:hypothetical protein